MIEEQDDFHISPYLKKYLYLDDDDIPEYWPHLRENREERYIRARKILEEKKRDEQFRRTLVEIYELPEI